MGLAGRSGSGPAGPARNLNQQSRRHALPAGTRIRGPGRQANRHSSRSRKVITQPALSYFLLIEKYAYASTRCSEAVLVTTTWTGLSLPWRPRRVPDHVAPRALTAPSPRSRTLQHVCVITLTWRPTSNAFILRHLTPSSFLFDDASYARTLQLSTEHVIEGGPRALKAKVHSCISLCSRASCSITSNPFDVRRHGSEEYSARPTAPQIIAETPPPAGQIALLPARIKLLKRLRASDLHATTAFSTSDMEC